MGQTDEQGRGSSVERIGGVQGLVRRAVVFSGRVQGVGFRATTRDIAAGFGVTGWVRNEADGSVMTEVQGTPDQVRDVLNEVANRFKRHITSVNTMDGRVDPEEKQFEIR